VNRLADIGYLDDARFAFGRARSLAERGYGDDAVRFELEREGVAADRIDAAVAGLAGERERALSVLRGSRSALAGIRKLAAKGFSADSIEAAAAEARIDLNAD
jgi:regulatory protein